MYVSVEKCERIIKHMLEFEFLYADDIIRYKFCPRCVSALVEMRLIDKHFPNQYDELCFDLSNEAHKALMEDKVSVKQLVEKSIQNYVNKKGGSKNV